MNVSMHFCSRSLRQIKHAVPKSRIQLLLHVEKCTKLSAVALSQAALQKPHCEIKGVERNEVLLIKNLLAGNNLDQENQMVAIKKSMRSNQNIAMVEKRPCNSESGHCNYKNQLVWQDVLLGPKHIGRQNIILKEYSNLIGISPEMWYCTNVDDACPKKKLLNESCVEFSLMDRVQSMKVKENSVSERKITSGPSPEQLSLVLLRLREELPNFFDGHHRYSIYSKDILFVNKLTRTTTRTLKSYKYIMRVMAYGGRLFWTKASLDIIRITKHSEDNTIKVRWTAKGMPWYQLPFFQLSGKPQSFFYRYVDGFSIFEVGRDGLVHCHRLDKVMPTAIPERQKWSLRMQVLALLGLAEITHEPCEAFQVKSQEILK